MAIGYREGESVMWEEISPEVAQRKWSYTRPTEWQQPWPALEDELRKPMRDFVWKLRNEGVWVYRDARFDLASLHKPVPSRYQRKSSNT